MVENISELREQVFKKLKKRKISLAQCGREIGISQEMFRRFLNGTSNPQYHTLLKIHAWANEEQDS